MPNVVRRTLTINGEKWKLLFRAPRKSDAPEVDVAPDDEGLCSYEDNTIYIKPSGEALGTAIHEVLHAVLPDNDEDSIARAEDAVMRLLSVFPKQYLCKETAFEL